jgi:hypothetical protein
MAMAMGTVVGRWRWQESAMKRVQRAATVGASRESRCQRARGERRVGCGIAGGARWRRLLGRCRLGRSERSDAMRDPEAVGGRVTRGEMVKFASVPIRVRGCASERKERRSGA